MKNALATLVLLLVICQSAFATGPGNNAMFVSGTVIDQSSHESLAGVKVQVKGTDIITYTNFDGNFFLPEMPKGEYTLEFSYITYSTEVVVTDPNTLEPQLQVVLNQR